MSDAPIRCEYEPRFDEDRSCLEFTFTGSNDELIASSAYATEAKVREWLARIKTGQRLELVLCPHTYSLWDEEPDIINDLVLGGTIIASFWAGEAEYIVPPSGFADCACRLLYWYSLTEFRVFRLLSNLSPQTARVFIERLNGMALSGGLEPSRRGLQRLEPTILHGDLPLSEKQVVYLFEDGHRAMSLRQLEEFLPMKMQNLKPHLHKAGILPNRRTSTRGMAVTTSRLLDKLIPYMEQHPNQQFIEFLGLLRDNGIIAEYEKPNRP